jgi:hypothetical protein
MDISELSLIDAKNLDCKMYRNGTFIIYKRFARSEKEKESDSIFDAAFGKAEKEEKDRKKNEYKHSRTKIQSASLAAWAVKQSKYMLFFTVTIPKSVPEKQMQEAWKRFCNLLTKNYSVSTYVWVLEKGEIGGRYHYHILVDRNRIPIKKLQASWEMVFFNVTGIVHKTHNSVRLGKRPVVYSVRSVKNYLAKYIAKDEDNSFSVKAYGYTETLKLSKHIDVIDAWMLVKKYALKPIIDDGFLQIYRLPFTCTEHFMFFDSFF